MEPRGDVDDDGIERGLAAGDGLAVELDGGDGVDALQDELGDGGGRRREGSRGLE